MEQVRPENIPEKLRTQQEQAGLDYEATHTRTPPLAFYAITQIIYSYFGLHVDYFHFALCKAEHQLYHYRHRPSDSFLRMGSFCCECSKCPQRVIEHAHPPGYHCNIKCNSRLVYRPGKQLISICGHNCWTHVEPFPTFFSRPLIPIYPTNMPFSPYFKTKEAFRHSANLAKRTARPAEKMVKMAEERIKLIQRFSPTIDPEDFINLFAE